MLKISTITSFLIYLVTGSLVAQSFNQEALQLIADEANHYYQEQQVLIDSLSRNGAFNKTIALPDGEKAVVKYIEDGKPVYVKTFNDQARNTTNVEIVQAPDGMNLNLLGQGITVGVWDGGSVLTTHQEFGNRVVNIVPDEMSNHATHVTGTIAAAGVSSSVKGMVPEVRVRAFYAFENDIGPMAAEAANGMILSNHSYGLALGWDNSGGSWQWYGSQDLFGNYNSNQSRAIDNIAYNAPNYLIVWAAGNDRNDTGNGSNPPDGPYDCIGPEGVAKNNLVVGAINGFNNYDYPEDAVMSNFSSWGPIDDGRVKPDIVGDGVAVSSTGADNDEHYYSSNGTSMASPNVTGSLVLIQQYYKQLYGDFMTSASLKALALHTAREAGPAPGPDYMFGWGVLNTAAAIEIVGAMESSDTLMMEGNLTNSDKSDTITFFNDGSKPFTATIVWTDPPSQPSETGSTELKLLNDLDLRVVGTDSTHLPWILDPSRPGGNARRGDNFRDNVEKIEIPAGDINYYQIVVSTKNETFVNDQQRYSLVITGSAMDQTTDARFWTNGGGSLTPESLVAMASGAESTETYGNDSRTLIFDNGSGFSTGDRITLDNDFEVNTLYWDADEEVQMDLMGNTLHIHGNMIIKQPTLNFVNGRVMVHATGNSTLQLSGSAENVSLQLEGEGSHTITGMVAFDKLVADASTIQMEQAILSVDSLVVHNSSIDFANSRISGFAYTSLLNNTGTSSGNRWDLGGTLESDIWLNSDTLVVSADLAIIGEVDVAKIIQQGNIQSSSTITTDFLDAKKGSIMALNGNELKVEKDFIMLDGNAGFITFSGNPDTRGKVNFDFRKLICADNLIFENIDFTSKGKLNLIGTSTQTNSTNLLQIDCDDVLFADFRLDTLLCSFSVVNFSDNSKGAFEDISIKLLKGANNRVIDGDLGYIIFDEAGIYNFEYIITNQLDSDTLQAQVDVMANDISEVAIIENDNGLVSSFLTDNYLWFRDGQLIDGQSARILPFPLETGNYRVGAYIDNEQRECTNRVSAAFRVETITTTADSGVQFFPNPVNDYLTILSKDYSNVVVRDLTGKIINVSLVKNSETYMELNFSNLISGVYFVELISINASSKTFKIIKK